ncbi:MAG: glycosyltransferase [Microcoleaceae cyanobacterium]
MVEPVDLLLITYNRRQYLQKTLTHLLNSSSNFRLYCWDNASVDGTADIIASIDDERVVKRHFSKENVNQFEPCMWFFETAESDVIGKIDDDVLLPEGWTEQFASLIRQDSQFGMLGCWIFMPEDWNINLAAHNIVEISGHKVFQCTMIAGHSFLARKEYLRHYSGWMPAGIPLDRVGMSIDGLVSGYPLPLMYAHNMDDPRSPLNMTMQSGEVKSDAGITCRRLGFDSPEDFANWIAKDALLRQKIPLDKQLTWHKITRDQTRVGRLRQKILRPFVKPKV